MLNLLKRDFTQVPNALIVDESIDKVARFLFVYLATRPEDWKFRNAQLCKAIGISDDTLRKYMNELVSRGWIGKQQKKGLKGEFLENEIVLYPYPNFSGTEPSRNFPGTEKTGIGKTRVLNNTEDSTNTELFTNTEDISAPHQVLKYLNEKKGGRGFSFDPKNLTEIKSVLKRKFTVADCQRVIDAAVIQWGGDPEQRKYIRPITLFGKKFESYLVAADDVIKRKPKDDGSSNFVYHETTESDLI